MWRAKPNFLVKSPFGFATELYLGNMWHRTVNCRSTTGYGKKKQSGKKRDSDNNVTRKYVVTELPFSIWKNGEIKEYMLNECECYISSLYNLPHPPLERHPAVKDMRQNGQVTTWHYVSRISFNQTNGSITYQTTDVFTFTVNSVNWNPNENLTSVER